MSSCCCLRQLRPIFKDPSLLQVFRMHSNNSSSSSLSHSKLEPNFRLCMFLNCPISCWPDETSSLNRSLMFFTPGSRQWRIGCSLKCLSRPLSRTLKKILVKGMPLRFLVRKEIVKQIENFGRLISVHYFPVDPNRNVLRFLYALEFF